MKRHALIRCTALLAVTLLLGAMVPALSHAWDPATHAFMEEHLYKKQGKIDQNILNNRIYGSFMIDIFNNRFVDPYETASKYLHNITQDNFLKLYDAADSSDERAFAYGFVSHNNTWGMDSTSHVSGITYGRGQGYVIAKAAELGAMLRPSLEASGLVLPDNVLLDICHYLVESGVDFLVRSLDPEIGNKLAVAAWYRSGDIPQLFMTAYANELSSIPGAQGDAGKMIEESELSSRQYLLAYGWALTQENALELVAGGLARQGTAYFAAQGYPPIPEAVLKQIAEQGIMAAMWLCAPDFEGEVRATTGWVNGNLSSNGIVW